MLRASGPQHPPLKDGSAGAWRERGDFTHLNSTVSPTVFFSCHVDDVCFFRLSRVYFNMASATGFCFVFFCKYTNQNSICSELTTLQALV